MRIFQLLPEGFIHWRFFGQTMRVWLPLVMIGLLVGGLFSPLFDLNHIHGFSSKVFFQHFYFDFIAGLGGFWASTFCKHWYHRVPLFIGIDVLVTFLLVTIVG